MTAAGPTARRALLGDAARELRRAGIHGPWVEAQVLLAHVVGDEWSRVLLTDDVTGEQQQRYGELIRRRVEHEPLQHIVGTAPFRHLELAVGPGVFVPRPETELVVELAAAALATARVVVDLCSGSGALALAVAGEYPGRRVVAVERSPEALIWLRRNAVALAEAGDTAVEVVAADIRTWDPGPLTRSVDVVVANPPYVPDATAVGAEVRADPPEAVFAGSDGLALLPAVATLAARLLRAGGRLVVEHDEDQAEAARAIVAGVGFTDVTTEHDLTGRDRFVTAVRSPATDSGQDGAPVGMILDCIDPSTRPSAIEAGVRAVRAGQLLVLPTDTVYGLGADAFDGGAVMSLLAAKGRGRDMPVPVLVGSWDTIDGLVTRVGARTRDLVEAFWPGALTLVVEHARSLTWDLGDSRGTVALRMPLHPVALEVLRTVGPMAVSSANRTGQPPARDAHQAREQLGDLVSVYLDAGPAGLGVASTIVDVTTEVPTVLRVGALGIDELRRVVPELQQA